MDLLSVAPYRLRSYARSRLELLEKWAEPTTIYFLWLHEDYATSVDITLILAPSLRSPIFIDSDVAMAEDRKASVASRKKSVAQEAVTSVLRDDEVPVYDREYSADEEVLAALGYKPEFKREFSLWTSFCVSFAVLGLLPSFASTLYYVSRQKPLGQDSCLPWLAQGMGYAGTPGMVWGWLIAMFFIQCVAMSMAELCSSMPTSGGLYYASAVLAPPYVNKIWAGAR